MNTSMAMNSQHLIAILKRQDVRMHVTQHLHQYHKFVFGEHKSFVLQLQVPFLLSILFRKNRRNRMTHNLWLINSVDNVIMLKKNEEDGELSRKSCSESSAIPKRRPSHAFINMTGTPSTTKGNLTLFLIIFSHWN